MNIIPAKHCLKQYRGLFLIQNKVKIHDSNVQDQKIFDLC